MNKFDKFIIRETEDIYLKDKVNIIYNKEKEFENLMLFYAIYFLAIIIPMSIMDSEFGWRSFLINTAMALPILIIITFTMHIKRVILLHKLMFWSYKEREVEINAFIENNRTHINEERAISISKKSYKYNDLDEEMDKYLNNIDGFCDKYLSHHNSLKKFIKERLQDKASENRAFIFWCILIPNKQELSLDALKFLISQNRLSYTNYTLFKTKDPEFIKAIKSQKVKAFSNFSEKQLKRIFSTHYDSSLICNVFSFSWAHDYSYPEELKNLAEIDKFIKLHLDLIKLKNKKLYQIERNPRLYFINNKQFRGLKFIVLDDTEDLIDWGIDLRNCIKTYRDRCINGYSYLLGVYKGGDKYANIELDSQNQIVQIKGLANRNIIEESDIREIIALVLD